MEINSINLNNLVSNVPENNKQDKQNIQVNLQFSDSITSMSLKANHSPTVLSSLVDSIKEFFFGKEESEEEKIIKKIKSLSEEVKSLFTNTGFSKEEIKARMKLIRARFSELSNQIYSTNEKNKKYFEHKVKQFTDELENYLLHAKERTVQEKEKVEIQTQELFEKLLDSVKGIDIYQEENEQEQEKNKDSVGVKLKNLSKEVKNLFTNTELSKEEIKERMKLIREKAAELGDQIATSSKEEKNALKDKMKQLIDRLDEHFSDVKEKAAEEKHKLGAQSKKFFEKLSDKLKKSVTCEEACEEEKDSGNVTTKIKDVSRELKDLFTNTGLDKEEVKARMKLIRARLSELGEQLYASSREEKDAFSEKIEQLTGALEDYLLHAKEKTAEEKNKLEAQLKEFCEKLLSGVKGAFTSKEGSNQDTVASKIKNLAQELKDLFANTGLNKEEVKARMNLIRERFSELGEQLYASSREEKNSFVNKMKQLAEALEDYLLHAKERTAEEKHKLEAQVKDFFDRLSSGVKGAFISEDKSKKEAFQAKIDEVSKEVMNLFTHTRLNHQEIKERMNLIRSKLFELSTQLYGSNKEEKKVFDEKVKQFTNKLEFYLLNINQRTMVERNRLEAQIKDIVATLSDLANKYKS